MAVETIDRADWRQSSLVVAAAGSAILFWAGTATATRAITGTLDPLLIGALRTVGAGAVAIPLLLLLRLPGPRGGYEWGLLLVSAIGSLIGFPVLFSLGAALTSASHASLIQAALPLFTGFSAAVAERRLPHGLWWWGAALAFAGETALVIFRDHANAGDASALGDLLILGGCITSAIGYVAGGRLAARITALGASFWVIAVASLMLLPVALWRGQGVDWRGVSVADWSILAYLALGSTLLAFIGWYWALVRGGIARVAVLQFAQPVLSVALAVVLLGERVTLPLVLAGSAILLGIAVARRGRSPATNRPA